MATFGIVVATGRQAVVLLALQLEGDEDLIGETACSIPKRRVLWRQPQVHLTLLVVDGRGGV